MGRPKVLLFDIGGVVVISPMSAIADYERTHSLPPGYINTAISSHSPDGAWQRLERGEIPLDATFFAQFKRDLTSPRLWREYYARHLERTRPIPTAQAIEEAAVQKTPPVPDIDGHALFWAMMGAARAPDPHMYPAVRRLRAIADGGANGARRSDDSKQSFIVAACSNTVRFPPGHPYDDPKTAEGSFTAQMKDMFHLFVSSAHVGMRKPERRMYEYTLAECERVARERGVIGADERLRGEDVVFADDIGGNLRGGRELGFRGIKVVMGKTEATVRELESVMGLKLRDDSAKL